MRKIRVSIGGKHNAQVKQTWEGSFERFCEIMTKNVPETMKKDSVGWVCGAEFEFAEVKDNRGRVFKGPYRDSDYFLARHLLSFDYDHISLDDYERIVGTLHTGPASLAYTTWSHTCDKPRLRIWYPLSRPVGYDEFQAISRKVGARAGIELLARESHVPCQYMFRPAIKPFEEFQSWKNTSGAWLDVDQILGEYDDWTDRDSWPHRADGDGVHNEGASVDPRTKPGIVGAFCRAFTITDAIEKFQLPYAASSPGRYTYTEGSRPDGCIVYDDDTKLHSHHDTDPARGQSNAYDLVRLHRFGSKDNGKTGLPLADRPSTKLMRDFALREPLVQAQFIEAVDFDDLGDLPPDTSEWDDVEREGSPAAAQPGSKSDATALPDRISDAISPLTDQGNAARIQEHYGSRIISVGKSFYFWEGTHWEEDETPVAKAATKLSKLVAKDADKLDEEITAKAASEQRAVTVDEQAKIAAVRSWAKTCASRKTRTACVEDLRSLLNFDGRKLNTHPHLFSCANGTLNLRTGEMRKHRSKDFITACSKVAYDPAAEAPRFQRFLREIYLDDEEMVAFAQRWFGYCLTGEVNEHKMVFHVGRGGNGKGTMMDIMKYILGAAYLTAPQKLMNLDETGATPDLANLLGRRMVTIRETDETLEIRDGLVKLLTGGDQISCRKLHKNPFEFMPTHKLQVFTNHAPTVRTQDFAMWRRILLVHYPVSYGDQAEIDSGEAQRLKDPELEKALQAEAPGILAWLVAGAREWYSGRLRPPESVLKATREYRDDQDVIKQFVKERLVADSSAWVALNGVPESVYPSYRGWCTSMNCRPFGRNRLVRELLRVVPGSSLEHQKGIQGFKGFALAQQDFLD